MRFVCSWSAAAPPMLGTMDQTALRRQSVSGAGRPRPDGRALSAGIVLAGLGSLACHFVLSRTGAALAYDAPAAVAIVLCVAAWRCGEPRRTTWLFLAAGTSASVVGDLVYSFADTAFPGPADVAYLASYPLFAVALLTFVPHRRAETLATLLDATLATMAISLFVVLFWLEPLATAGGESLPSRILSCAYPVGDLLLVAIGITAALQTGRRHSLVLAAMATLLGSDLVYSAEIAHSSYVSGNVVDAGWMCAYTLLALAAVQGLRKRASSPDADALGWRCLVLAGAALFAVPAAAALEIATGGANQLPRADRLEPADRHPVVRANVARRTRAVPSRAEVPHGLRQHRNRDLDRKEQRHDRDQSRVSAFGRLHGRRALADALLADHPSGRHGGRRAGHGAAPRRRAGSCTIEKRYVRSDGTVRWVRVTVSATPMGGFDIGLIEDITDRRRLLARTVEAAEHERLALAADLHDGPVQHLTATAFTLDLLVNRLTRESSSEAAELARRLRDDVAAEMTSLRRTMTGLRSPVIDARNAYPSVEHAPSNAIYQKAGFTLRGSHQFEYPKNSSHNEFWSLLKQTRQQPMARKASWISARRS